MVGRTAGYVFDQVDGFLGKLGKPLGVMSYKPYNSIGEDFLHNYIGMLGIPMELTPEFPTDAKTIFLTESAKFDPAIVDKIKGQLNAGKNVIITSGLLKALARKGHRRYRRTSLRRQKSRIQGILAQNERLPLGKGNRLPAGRISSPTTPGICCLACRKATDIPLLLEADYAKGILYVLTIPDNFADLYNLPAEALNDHKRSSDARPARARRRSQRSEFVHLRQRHVYRRIVPAAIRSK